MRRTFSKLDVYGKRPLRYLLRYQDTFPETPAVEGAEVAANGYEGFLLQ